MPVVSYFDIEVRAETLLAKANRFLLGIVSMATCWVKRQNPYLRARPCQT